MKNIVSIFIFLILVISFSACNSLTHLRLKDAKTEDVKGTFTLILYGGRYPNDIETVAILDLEEDQYTFEPYAPEFDYKVKNGIPAKEALNEATDFISHHYAFHSTQLGRITDNKGNTLGYELRPLYMPLEFGTMDVLDINYRTKNNKVIVTIRLTSSVEKMLYDGNILQDSGR